MAELRPLRLDSDRLSTLCAAITPTADCSQLAACLNRALAPLQFAPRLSRSGWYRSGGIISAEGERIGHSLRQWVEAQGEDDPLALIETYADSGWWVTRLSGTTHYLSAVDPSAAAGFIQLEVEELCEVVDRPLVSEQWYPDDLEEFIDPTDVAATGVGPPPIMETTPPYYRFRRLTPLSESLAPQPGEQRQPSKLQRMLDDWWQSSASQTHSFCERWVVSVTPFLDRYGEQRYTQKLIPVHDAAMALDDSVIERGSKLAQQIHSFDRHMGYPMAWYFCMLARHKVSTRIAEAIHLDLMGAYDYLPAGDVKLLRRWSAEPYTV